MEKKIYLICNSHIDPIWMWDWDDGASTTLSTFYSATKLLEEFDFVFCHNEMVLYEYVEKYDKELFKQIQELVKDGKWKVMGGWYLQPDCNLPSGESFVRQIMTGKEYFKDKFSTAPETAINFDSFGHTKGLVQILKKCGYHSYLVCRPSPELLPLENDLFLWKGFDNSVVKCYRSNVLYADGYQGLKNRIEAMKKDDKTASNMFLWGVGNHGGGPSRKDLTEIAKIIEKEDFTIKHSYPEEYFIENKTENILDKSLRHTCRGAYTSMSSVKQRHIRLEKELLLTEKICSLANLLNGTEYPEEQIREAVKNLCFIEFHDVLSGTCVEVGEQSAIRKADYALKLLKDAFVKAFFDLTKDFVKNDDVYYPIAVFNPHPYEWETVIESDFLLKNPYPSNEDFRNILVYNAENFELLPSQVLEEGSNINYDRMKRVAFKAKLQPFSVNLFLCKDNIEPCKEKVTFDNGLRLDFSNYSIKLDENGRLCSFVVDGVEKMEGNLSFYVCDDTGDSWGWGCEPMTVVGENPCEVHLSSCDKGPFRGLKPICVIEDGDLMTTVECLYEYGGSFIRLKYKFFKEKPLIDLEIITLWAERHKMLKLFIPAKGKEFLGQTAFGYENLDMDGSEQVAHRFVSVKNDNKYFLISNDCSYGCSYKDGVYISLLRGASYCAHFLEGRKLISKENFVPDIEQGRHVFNYRMQVVDENEQEIKTSEFVNKPYSLNVFPHGTKTKVDSVFELSNKNICLVALKKSTCIDGAYIIRLQNNSIENASTELSFMQIKKRLNFKRFEVKTLIYQNLDIIEADEMLI